MLAFCAAVDTELSPGYGSDTTGPPGLGRDAALGTGVMGAGAATDHHHGDRDTGRSFPLGGSSTNTTGRSAPGQTGAYSTGGTTSGYPATSGSSTTAGPHSSNLANKADPRIDSDLDGSRGLGGSSSGVDPGIGSGIGSSMGSSNTTGPHSSNLANKADPRVDSDLSGKAPPSNTGYGSTASGVGSGMGYGPESWRHDHGAHGHTYEGDPCSHEEAARSGPHFIPGPHVTDTANLLDPHVNSGSNITGAMTSPSGDSGTANIRSRANPSTSSGVGNTGDTTSSSSGGGPGLSDTSTATGPSATHHGRDAPFASGTGNAGLRAHESNRDQPGSSMGPAPTTAGPHKSDILNKLDPHVDSDQSKQRGDAGSGTGSSTTGSGLGPSTIGTGDRYQSSTTDHRHHAGRDAGLAGAALGGGTAYEGARNQGIHDPTQNVGSSYPASDMTDTPSTAGDHHLGRDAGLVGAGTAAGYEASRHHGQPTQSSTVPSTLTGSSTATGPHSSGLANRADPRVDSDIDGSRGLRSGPAATGTTASSGPYSSNLANKADPRIDSDMDGPRGLGSGTTVPGYDSKPSTGHHYGRDAGLVGAGGIGAYEADKHLGSHSQVAPQDRLAGSGHHSTPASATSPQHRLAGSGHQPTTTTSTTTTSTTNPYHPSSATDRPTDRHADRHSGRDAALGAGAGAGAAGLAAHEYNDKEAKALEKEHQKEMKHAEKEHQKEVKHAEKEHQKDVKHAEKEHQKDVKHAEKEHEKEVKHAEKHAEKEHQKDLKHAEKHAEKERQKELKHAEKEHHKEAKNQDAASGEKKPGLMDRILHRHHDDKDTESADRDASLHDPATGKGLQPNRRGDDEASGTTGLENRMASTGLDDARHGGHPVGGEMQHGSSSGVHDPPLGSGITTHDAYGTNEGQNKLHKDPPVKVLEEHGLR